MKITKITYEEDRLEFFIKERDRAEKNHKLALEQLKPSDNYLSDEHYIASGTGRVLSFYNDIVEMLMKERKRANRLAEKPCIYKHTCGHELCTMSECPEYEPKTKGKKWFEEMDGES